MKEIIAYPAIQIFLGTFPVLLALLYNVIEVRSLRSDMKDLSKKVGELAERVSKIEGKIEGRQVILQ